MKLTLEAAEDIVGLISELKGIKEALEKMKEPGYELLVALTNEDKDEYIELKFDTKKIEHILFVRLSEVCSQLHGVGVDLIGEDP